ncbi:MAG: bifunctional 5,10-methylenetetrahydrofolate dehydrogenase/5,10-methenyltetrahydrofolate cyclohydrolase [Candidatus Omnitrophica bacterium]|nr:bifunctional 5,10-methylenetetrahydrofolate dehydrogenase/5,10-methenyltetrahydrofolate cyclohydrolase [Candidatus Omnitrophota bacterium]
MVKLLEGKPLADKIKEEIKLKVASLKNKPVLASILIGDDPSSVAYVKSQAKTAQSLGITYKLHQLDINITQRGLIDFISGLNADKTVNGIIVQTPLPVAIDYKIISGCISPLKDIEGMHALNMGKMFFSQADLVPCTAGAVMELLNSIGANLSGKEVVVVGHSEIVGKPLALLLLEKLATVTVCHIGTSKANKLEEHVRRAEVLIVAVGQAGLIKGKWIKKGAIVIDVGINRVNGLIVGDVEFAAAAKRAAYISPVPGGVGPLTVAMLMRNLLQAVKLQQ